MQNNNYIKSISDLDKSKLGEFEQDNNVNRKMVEILNRAVRTEYQSKDAI